MPCKNKYLYVALTIILKIKKKTLKEKKKIIK